MKLKFFKSKPTGLAPKEAIVSVRRLGQASLNSVAQTALNAEPGGAATICLDEDSQAWLLVHWPNGHQEQPLLHALSKNGKGLRFQSAGVAAALFEAVPGQGTKAITCRLNPAAITSADMPEAVFYHLTLPTAVPAAPAPTVKKGGARG